MDSIANLSVAEGTCNTAATVSFPWRARYIEIINDSGSDNLTFKFNTSESFSTLKPTEAVVVPVHSNTVYLASGDSVAYSVRSFG